MVTRLVNVGCQIIAVKAQPSYVLVLATHADRKVKLLTLRIVKEYNTYCCSSIVECIPDKLSRFNGTFRPTAGRSTGRYIVPWYPMRGLRPVDDCFSTLSFPCTHTHMHSLTTNP